VLESGVQEKGKGRRKGIVRPALKKGGRGNLEKGIAAKWLENITVKEESTCQGLEEKKKK